MQSEYWLPKESYIALCDDLKKSGLLSSRTPEVADGEFVLRVAERGGGKPQPFLSGEQRAG
jgi:hypothetical protein